MADWDFILAPSTVTVEIKYDEVAILINMLRMIGAHEHHSGLHEWILNTASELSKEQLEINYMVCNYIDSICCTDIEAQSFPEFIENLSSIKAERLQDISLHWLRPLPDYPGDEEMMKSKEAFLHYVERLLGEKYAAKGEEIDLDTWAKEYDYLQNPQELLDLMAEHLQFMWEHYLKPEWKRVKPIIEEAVEAFSAIDYSGMSAFEAIETVTGRNMRGKDFFEERLEKADTLVFMPSAHLGPYISWGASDDDTTMIFFFGARPPKGAKMKSTALSRSELLVRLNALADETRLKILELLTHEDEMCAQDFINELDLSQSSASRHLRQLTASGYVSERRRDVAKCYSLNPERIDDTIRSLKEFLNKG